jgi:hypothetical protein
MAVLIMQVLHHHIQRAVVVAQEQWDRLHHHPQYQEQAGLEQTVVSLVRLLRMQVVAGPELVLAVVMAQVAWEVAVRAPPQQLLLPEQPILVVAVGVQGILAHLVQEVAE